MWRWSGSLGIKQKLVVLSLLILLVVSFGFSLLHLTMSRRLAEEDLQERAVAFAREIAATIGDRREFESGLLLEAQIRRIMAVRQNVLQLDVLAFGATGTTVVATSHPESRLPLTRQHREVVRRGQVVPRLVTGGGWRYWEVVAPVLLEGETVGAVAAKFSLDRADALAARVRTRALVLTAISVVVMGLLMSMAVEVVVNRPIRRFVGAIERIERGDTGVTVRVAADDEFRVLASKFNEMVVRLEGFNAELQARIVEATRELERRYREVERLNEVLFATQRKLGHAERLALSGRLMAQVAHEVGTPLHSIAGHVELLRQDLGSAALTDAVRRRFEIVDDQLRRVSEIISQLLDLTRAPAGERESVDVNALVRDTVDLVRPGVSAGGLQVIVAIDAEVPAVRGHRNQLQQALLNLLTNAIDATPPGGTITVRTAATPAGAELAVADTGRGIGEAERARIFEPFFSTKSAGRGAGLGLFIVSAIVREHRGQIDLESEPGKGTTFRVRLPRETGRP
ncbi:MAG: HAMP domain-containing protein [Candidatus Rokubacteria bacterium]|nr:HAMP domain-containing protein [Candidatus Rokubacteria bacterium]